jgi:hypothetical protein
MSVLLENSCVSIPVIIFLTVFGIIPKALDSSNPNTEDMSCLSGRANYLPILKLFFPPVGLRMVLRIMWTSGSNFGITAQQVLG